MRVTVGFALVSGLLFAAVPAKAGESVTVVELFTSQGCPSCPSADRMLGELAKRNDILALSLHVDHWDFIGWRDPFASALYSQRQQRYLEQHNLPYVYTPQIVVDGRFQASGNKPEKVIEGIRQARAEPVERVDVKLERISDGQVHLLMPEGASRYRDGADIVLVRFDEKRTTDVTRGENSGRTLTNYHVVRLMRPIAQWDGEAVDALVTLQDIEGASPDYCAVIVQERGQRRILGASVVDMRSPKPTAVLRP